MNKRHYITMSLLALVTSVHIVAMDGWGATRCAFGFIGAGVALTGAEYFSESPLVVDVSKATGTDVEDAAAVVSLPFVSLGLRELVRDDMKPFIDHVGVRAVPAAALAYMTQTRLVRKVFGNIPFFGKYLSCENEKCSGSCKQCHLRTGLTIVGTYMAFDRVCNAASESLYAKNWDRVAYVLAPLVEKREE